MADAGVRGMVPAEPSVKEKSAKEEWGAKGTRHRRTVPVAPRHRSRKVSKGGMGGAEEELTEKVAMRMGAA